MSNHKVCREDLVSTQAACVEGLKSLVSHHNLTVTHESWSLQTLRQSVSNHIVGTEGNKIDDTSKGKFTYMVSVNVIVSGVFSADWISRHGNIRRIIFIDVGATFLSISESMARM